MEFTRTEVFNLDGAIRGMRNPMDSWSKSDSYWMKGYQTYFIGENDLKLAQQLIKAGNEHRKFLRQIFVSTDIIAPRYWWSEFDTYKINTVSNSCSTMHKLASYPITLDMFEIDPSSLTTQGISFYEIVIEYLESLRQQYNNTKDIKYFRAMKQALPESFKQKRTITMNYENIRNMIHSRKNHRLKEWSTDFILWSSKLPYSEQFIFD